MTPAVTPRTVPLLAFCQATRQWTPLSNLVGDTTRTAAAQRDPLLVATTSNARSSSSTDTSSLTCVTYNVFSGPSSSSIAHLGNRIKASISILRRSDADIIALQEVSSAYERALLRERWLRNDFAVTSLKDFFLASTDGKSTTTSARQEDDGCLLVIKRKHLSPSQGNATMTRLSGPQGKVLISLPTLTGINVATSHFESLSASTSTRVSQYREAFLSLTTLSGPCILLGDFNHASYHELVPLLGQTPGSSPSSFSDITSPQSSSKGKSAVIDWEGSFRNKPTFGDLYPFFEGSRERRKPRRIDLVLTRPGQGSSLQLLRSWTEGSKPVEVEKRQKPNPENKADAQAGNAAKPKQRTKMVKLKCKDGKGGHCYPSDHIAVLATLRLVQGG